LAGFLKE